MLSREASPGCWMEVTGQAVEVTAPRAPTHRGVLQSANEQFSPTPESVTGRCLYKRGKESPRGVATTTSGKVPRGGGISPDARMIGPWGHLESLFPPKTC